MKQPSWTVTGVYVRPGDTLVAGRELLTLSALNIRVDQKRFRKLFQDVWRQLGIVRSKPLLLKELFEAELTAGGVRLRTGGFRPKPHRFDALDKKVS